MLAFTALAAALFFVVPAHAANLAMPSGAILDINNGNAANSASNTANTFKTYSVTFTAAQSGNNYVLFAFRQDPAYWTFGNLSMYAAGDTSANLFVNPLFTQGGAVQSSTNAGTTVQAPTNWGVVYQSGTVPNAAGTWHPPGSSGVTTTNVNTATAGSWYDGAVGSFDGIYQGVDLVAGIVYTINFTALSNQAANTAGSGNGGVEMGVFAGTCLTLTGPVANCVPSNPDFSVLATPDDAVNAGGPTSTPITSTTDTSDLGSHDGAFDGGTLVVDQDGTTSTGNHTISGNGGTIDQAGHESTFTGTISDATPGTPGSLTITNSGNGGSVTLTGTNTYSGGTTVEQHATLQGGTTSLQGNIDNDGTVRFNQNTDGTYAGTITGNGNLEKDGTGTVTLTGANDYAGNTTILDGTLALSGNGAIGGGRLGIVSGGTFDASGANHGTVVSALIGGGNVLMGNHDLEITNASGTFDGTISGTGQLLIDGGTQTLTGNNTYSGGTTVGNGAMVEVGSDGALGTGSLTLVGGNLYTGADRTLANDIALAGPGGTLVQGAGTTLTLSGDVAGNGDFIKNGAGALVADGTLDQVGKTIIYDGSLTLNGTNSYTGGTYLNGGTLNVSGDENLGNAAGALNFAGGTLVNTGNLASARDVNLLSEGHIVTDAAATTTLSGTVAGGALDLQGSGTTVLTGNNTYVGGTHVGQGGTLEIGADRNLGAAGTGISLDAATLHTTGDIASSRDIVVSASNGAVQTDVGTTFTTSGGITGSGDLIKTGLGTMQVDGDMSNSGVAVVDGTLILNGNNSFTDNAYVLGGATLQVNSGAALGSGQGALVLNGGTLKTTGNVDTSKNIIVSSGATLNVGTGTAMLGHGAVIGSGALIKNGQGSLQIDGVASHTGGTIVNDGLLVLTGANTYTGGNTLNGGVLAIGSDANLGSASNGVDFAGGTLYTGNSFSTARDLTFAASGGTIETATGTTLTATGHLAGSAGLVKDGAGTLDLSGVVSYGGGTTVDDGTLILRGNNTYAGGTHLNGGTLEVSSDSNLGNAAGALTFAGGTLHATGDIASSRNIDISTGTAKVVTDAGTTFATTGGVTGSGELVKTGQGTMQVDGDMSNLGVAVMGGTLVLNGSNSFTDNSYVLGGATLQVNSGAALGSGQGALLLGGGTLRTTGNVDTAKNIVVAVRATLDVGTGTTMVGRGDVSGTGALIKNGQGSLQIDGVASHTGGTIVNDGLLTLTAANTYTGGNTLNGGVLAIGSDANLGAASNGVAFAGGTLSTGSSFSTARDLTFSAKGGTIATAAGTTLAATGNLSGSAGLVKDGTGTLDLSGVASYGGGTTVNDGTLILRGNNTYTGGTTINGGTLQIASDANLGAASGNLAINGGNLAVTQSMTTARDIVIGSRGASIDTLDGVTLNQQGDMSGSGGLVKLGGGTLIVSGNNSFTGGTLIDGGVIRIDSGSSLGTGAILLNGGMLQTVATLGTGQQVIISGNSGVNVDAGTTTVLSGTLAAAAGDGCFTKTGKGKLSLTGAATLASGTCVQDGTLSANGSLVSSFVQVDQGAMLRGTGFISGPVNVEGTLAAGNSPGTLTVQGTVTMQSTSTLQVDIDGLGTANGAGNYSRVLVTGASNQFIADGTLAPTLRGITGNASNTYVPALGSSYRIVTADGGVVGRFASLVQPTSGLAANTRFIAFYGVNDGHSIDLRVAPTSYVGFMGANARRNGVAAASALDGSLLAQDAGTATGSQTALLYAVSALDAGGVDTLVQSLSGEVHADEAAAARAAGLGMQRDVTDHLGTDVASADAAHRVWANLTRDGNRSIADNQGTGFETGTDRTTAGIDLYAENGTVLGVAATHHDTNVIAHGGNGSIKGNSGMVYAQQAMGAFVLDGVAAYGSTDWTTRRADPLGGTSLESHASGKDSMASATLRMPWTTASGNRIEPYASAIWQKVERDHSTERGTSAAALSLDSLSQHGTRVLAGVAMGSKAADPLSTTLTWRAGVAVGADTGDLLDPTVHNTMSGQRFDTAAPGVGRGFVQLNANGTMRLGKSTYLYGGLTAEEGQRRSAYGVTAGVRVAF
jgi:autotransporter-associated beta strand protein